MKLGAVLLVAILGGCGERAASCRTDAEALGRLLATADTEPPAFMKGPGVVTRTDLPKQTLRTGPIVYVGVDATSYRGEVVRDDELDALVELAARLDASHRAALDERIYFVIDGAAPWRRVVETVRVAVEAGWRAPAFVFRAPPAKSPPGVPLDDQLDSSKPAPPLRAPAERAGSQLAGCPALVAAFDATGRDELARPGESKADALIRAIPPALIDCKCDVPMADLRAALWRMFANPDPSRAILLDPAAPAQRIALPAATPWSTASARFTATTKNVEFAIQ